MLYFIYYVILGRGISVSHLFSHVLERLYSKAIDVSYA